MKFTSGQLVEAGLANRETAEKVVEALSDACISFDINTPTHIAAFLAQCAHESIKFTAVQENLKYSAKALQRVWPKRFDADTAASYARQPERIANRAYAGRIGNGDEASGDGWRYRGRGFIQLTGRKNYAAFGKAIGEDVVSNPDLVAEPRLAALSAAWYWSSRNLNKLADTPGVEDETRVVNGGTLGLEEREKLFKAALAVFG
jgi:putative chitinase